MKRLSAYDQAVKLLARRTHFRREIADKLARRSYPRGEIEEALGRLESRRFLDDTEAARQFVAGRLARGGYGRARLAAELAARGVGREVAAPVLDELLPEDDLEAARAEARRAGAKPPAALARRLERRGFSPRAIAAVLRERGDDPGES
ncbi:MAG TPA: RecX family transcriptional regulator [Thermoanaerobaculia bacterium]|nr:RecX family transcriptional regulator [Thermoanaerobaculia bacterium]